MTPLTRAEIRSRFDRALGRFMALDKHLLEADVSERAITHRLGMYLQDEFPNQNVDCEYNRNGKGPKTLMFSLPEVVDRARQDIEAEIDTNSYSIPSAAAEERQLAHETVSTFPDIIVHRRGSNRGNILVVEVKKRGRYLTPETREADYVKLRGFTTKEDENAYNYALGIFLVVEIGQTEIVEFVDGELQR
jgi:hypothetical protein